MAKLALAKRRRKEVAAGSMDNDHEDRDRISELPLPILHHHILSLLSQKDAFRTCVLSKSWRHLGPTRPKLEFHESYFPDSKKQEFLSVLESTLQRYDDQKLPIQEFILGIVSNSSTSLLMKWMPKVLMNMKLKTFKLSTDKRKLSFPFQAQFLRELYLEGCMLNQISDNCINVKLEVLKCLSLKDVHIEEETLEKILSSCPSIQSLVLYSCHLLRTIKVKMARNLKHFDCYDFRENDDIIDSIEIDDVASLETIHISRCRKWLNNNCFFPRLKSLCLWLVQVPTELLKNLSSKNCPCLQVLELRNCYGFGEFFKLSNRSIKRLIINGTDRPIKAVIEAPNMLYFEFRSIELPISISFSKTPREWKSEIEVWRYSIPNADVHSTWLLKLCQFLKALSQSQISLDISCYSLTNQEIKYDVGGGGSSYEPVVAVEYLFLGDHLVSHEPPALLNYLLRTCRPRYIGLSLSSTKSQEEKSELAESIWETLVNKNGETWQQDLEESSIQVADKNTNEYWHPVQVCAFSDNQSIRFRLKWRDLS